MLNGPPKIPYLHMTEMRSRAWREEWHVTEIDMDDRLDEAALVIDTMGSFYPINITIDAGVFRPLYKPHKMRIASGAHKDFAPTVKPESFSALRQPVRQGIWLHDLCHVTPALNFDDRTSLRRDAQQLGEVAAQHGDLCCLPLTRHCGADCTPELAPPGAAAHLTAKPPRFLLPKSHAARPVDRGGIAECCWLWFRRWFP